MPHAETPRAETPPHNELPNEMLALIACLCMEHRPHELATERIATECAQDAGKWSHLAATLPPLVELSRTSEAARGRIGEALAPSARAALSHAASTINAAFPAADTDAAENAAGAPTLSSEASASTAMSTEGPAEMVLGGSHFCAACFVIHARVSQPSRPLCSAQTFLTPSSHCSTRARRPARRQLVQLRIALAQPHRWVPTSAWATQRL